MFKISVATLITLVILIMFLSIIVFLFYGPAIAEAIFAFYAVKFWIN